MSLTRIFTLLVCSFFIFACAEKKIIPPPVSPEEVRMEKAARYWERDDYPASQRLYQILSKRTDLSPLEQKTVWQRLGMSAYFNRDFEESLRALKKWAELDPLVRESWQWHEKYSLSLKETVGEDTYYEYITGLTLDMTLPFEVRKKAALTLAGIHFEEEMYPEAMSILEKIYSQAPADHDRKHLEDAFHDYLMSFSIEKLKAALPYLDREKTNYYPLNVFFWSLYSRQLEDDPSMWEALMQRLNTLSRQGEFVDQRPYIRAYEKWLEKFGVPVTDIVMLLPLSGQFSSSAWKILRGAGIAHWKMLQEGLRVKVRVINTDQDGWLQELKETDSVIVGGPVSRNVWEEITASGLNREKVFFTFLPSINDEGISGWRFFTSPGDQVRAIIDKSVNDLGITDFAVFYPDDEFGRSFAEIFWREATQKGVRISGLQSYPRNEPERWNNIVASFLDIKDMDTPNKYPSPDFQAVFIPDSLSRVKGLIPQFFYFDQSQLLFMGPMLWSQAYSPDTLEQQYFSLSITSGAWLDDNPSPAAMELRSGLDETLQGAPDFWVALGYDFAGFAAGLGNLPSLGEYDRINSQLANMDFHGWSMAPISWDDQGRARQDLHVLQMNRSNLALADMDYLNSLILIREARKAHWIETLMEKNGDEKIKDLLMENGLLDESSNVNTSYE